MAQDAAGLSKPFADLLKERRRRFNTMFEEARRAHPSLDPETVLDHLESVVGPVVDAVDRVQPGRVGEAAEVTYESLLRLFAAGLLGPGARFPILREGLRTLLPAAARHLAGDPARVVRSFTNAMVRLAGTPEVRVEPWIQEMATLAHTDTSLDVLLRLGQILAWRHGMAHFRQGALAACQGLEPGLALAALGCAGRVPSLLPTLLEALRKDPWVDPAGSLETRPAPRGLRIVRRVGGFRGFGGCFLQPPRVTASGGLFLACDTERSWWLAGDRFGATLHPSAEPYAPGRVRPFSVAAGGTVTLDGQTRVFPELEGLSSAASDGKTLAVTTKWSHAVYLVAHASSPAA